jgi:hypothetical protein
VYPVPGGIAGPPCLRGHKYVGLVLQVGGWTLDQQSSPVKRLLLRNTNRGGQGPYWAVEPYDDDETDMSRRGPVLHSSAGLSND